MPPVAPAPDADLVVVRGEVRAVPDEDAEGSERLALADAPDGRVFYSLSRSPDTVDMRYPGLCLIRGNGDMRRVSVHLAPGADEGLVPVLVAGAVVALRLLLQGELVLHASAVEVDGRALAFTGTAGMGKSTVATLFGHAGHPLLTDDVLRVSLPSAGGAVAHRGGLELRLRESARPLSEGVAMRPTADGRTAVDLPLSSKPELPLLACLVPQPSRTAERVHLRTLTPAEGLATLVRFPRLVGWCHRPSLAQQFWQLGDLAAAVPVAVADIPWGPPFNPAVPEQILEALCNGDLAGPDDD
jgi:hypothetical protein